jgi:hypothetical protein
MSPFRKQERPGYILLEKPAATGNIKIFMKKHPVINRMKDKEAPKFPPRKENYDHLNNTLV